MTAILRRQHGGVVDFSVYNRAARMRQAQEQGRIYDVTFLVCGAISLLVGGIVIMNMVTIFGGLLGLGLGAGFTKVMSDLIQQPVVLTPQIMLLGPSFSVFVGIFFGFYPAIKAARLNPIEALRYE